MSTNDRRHLINVHSSIKDKKPKVTPNDMRYGELAVNHFKGKAFLSTRVSDTEMELFPSVHYIEQYPFSSLTTSDLTVTSSTTLSGDTNISGDTHISGNTYIEQIIPGDKTFDNKMDENSLNAVQNRVVTKTILDNEKNVSSSLNNLNERIRDLSGKTITTISGDDSIIVNATTNTDGTANINLSASYDDHLDTGSTKAVQNKAIAQKLEELNEKITVSSGKGITGITGDDSIIASKITNTDGTQQINLSASYDDHLDTGSTKAVQNKVITEAIQKVSSSLNGKADYSGITGDEAISVTASSSKDIKITHKKGVQINQAGVDGTNGDITVNQTDEFGHIIASRPATANDIKKIGIASEGLTIKYGETKPVDNDLPGDFDRTEKVYDGKTPMTLVVPQKITDLEGGNDLAYVHLSGDTMTGDLTMSGASSSNTIVFSTSGLSGNSTVDIKAADAQLSMASSGVSINKNIAISGTVTATDSIFSSDIRLKNNIGSICPCKFDNISKIILKEFTFNDDKKQRLRYGVIAQDLQNAGLDNLVVEGDDGYLGVDYISFLVLKIAEMDNEIRSLKNDINELMLKK